MFKKSVFFVVFVMAACTGTKNFGNDPKEVLKDYISKTFSLTNPEEKNDLAQFLTGESKSMLLAMSSSDFKHDFIDSKRQFVKLFFRDMKKISNSEVSISYELIYIDQARGKDAKVTNKKLASMIFEDNKWLIKGVTNVKELIEYNDELTLP